MWWKSLILFSVIVGIFLAVAYIIVGAIKYDDDESNKHTKVEKEINNYMFKNDLKGIIRNLSNVESDLFELEGKPVGKKEYGEICSELREEIDGLILKYRAKIREIENEESK